MAEEKKSKIDSITIKSYLSSIIIILCLMIVTYALTFILPAGQYVNEEYTEIGNTRFPFYKFILSPFLVLGSDGNTLQEALEAIRLFALSAAPALTALVE